MNRISSAAAVAAILAVAACNSQVTVVGGGGRGGAASASASIGVTTGGPGSSIASGISVAVSSSASGGGCKDAQPLLSCEICTALPEQPVYCQPTKKCLHAGVVCSSCPEAKKFPIVMPPYTCDCIGGGELPQALNCQLIGGCCTVAGNEQFECGDVIAMVCVQHRCLFPPKPGECWTSADCKGGTCIGAFVCPCGAGCDAEDHPGVCEGPK